MTRAKNKPALEKAAEAIGSTLGKIVASADTAKNALEDLRKTTARTAKRGARSAAKTYTRGARKAKAAVRKQKKRLSA
jgi:uncharacterized protein YukE